MRGRFPSGPDYVEHLPGSPLARERVRAVLETLAGHKRVQEVCAALGISEPRFQQLRGQALTAAIASLEPGQVGRPSQTVTPQQAEIAQLKQQVAELQVELRTAQARAELALVMPQLVHDQEPPLSEAAQTQKKTPTAEVLRDSARPPSAWDEEEHVKRLQELAQPQRPELTNSARRRPASQEPQRLRERILRSHIVELRHWTEELGWNRQQIADRLHLSPRTLRLWEHDCDPFVPDFQPLGRPCLCSPPHKRNEVIALLDEVGPALGVPSLREAFPEMARAELEDLVHRYRRVWRQRHYQPLRILHWKVPGSVWAADFAEAPLPIDNIYPYLLAVRDLASGRQLLWLPVTRADSAEVVQALASLVAAYGAPLVLKTDNGSPFCAALQSASFGQVLFSPPYLPAYNGSVEAGIGSLKTRTQAHASRHGHPGFWSYDDVTYAQAEANATARPKGPSGPTPDDAWQARASITDLQRALFQATLARHRAAIRAQPDWTQTDPWTDRQDRALDRQAIRRALEEHGYLLYSRRRLPVAINKRKVANIT